MRFRWCLHPFGHLDRTTALFQVCFLRFLSEIALSSRVQLVPLCLPLATCAIAVHLSTALRRNSPYARSQREQTPAPGRRAQLARPHDQGRRERGVQLPGCDRSPRSRSTPTTLAGACATCIDSCTRCATPYSPAPCSPAGFIIDRFSVVRAPRCRREATPFSIH